MLKFIEKSGIKKEFKYIYEIVPRDKMILIFISIIPFSFLIFYTMITIGFVYIIYFNLKYIINKVTKENFLIKIDRINKFNNTKLYLIKEIMIEYPKSKSFLIFYNILKILNKKNNDSIQIKYKIFSYFIKKAFYIITLIPFLIFKINCIIFEEIKKLSKWDSDSLSAYIDNFLYNICLTNITDFLNLTENFKITIKNNKVNFNPPKSDKYFFKNIRKYIIDKKDFENYAEFRVLNSKKTEDGATFKHYCKVYNPFNWVKDKIQKSIIFEETKSKQILDSKGEVIKGKLEDSGSKNESIIINKIGPIITENKPGILTTIPITMTKEINEIKRKYSWNFVNELFFNEKSIYLNKNNTVKKSEDETLSDFYIKNFSKLNDRTKRFLDSRKKFNEENKSVLSDLTEKELEQNLKNDFKRLHEFELNVFNDFDDNNNYDN